ncbi:EF Tu GTP binding domain-containing protein [Dacryopinax primogenitus]|uniref:EF Tu GTP binding domain-containing protein n=1 Tax=Dacryopinax primogenitus (strain DJM 731) TaxID=1858805 RepID=M5FNN0_DACPD|nr:EF Tu GTP binding domain-containing protein [Dacryopinax primogenitus]EJT97710.1 EF Tu GTP binding domain-containing protein [Dacryopinax primogenitus]
MGRLMYELGEMDEKIRRENERGSERAGKASFKWAWALDESAEERERGVTMDVATTHIRTPSLLITLLDAPGHADFVPNMISGAAQADAALLVVDAAPNSFEAGFERAGQTREHLVLVRALGVSQVVIAVNKIDLQAIDQESRYDEIVSTLSPFLVQSGFQLQRTVFVPLSGMEGLNLTETSLPWYTGPTLLDALDALKPPQRPYTLPLRIPLANVFKGQTAMASGVGVSGTVASGVVQVGDRVRILPGDESAVVRLIEQDESSLPWAAAGSTVTLYLAGVDPIHLDIGSVLCPPDALVPLTTTFTAQIIVFDIQLPLTSGASVELFHHSRDVPCTLTLLSTLDRTTGTVLKRNPRVLTRGQSARVQVSLREGTISGAGERVAPVPLETFTVNKDMGRILLRRGGETVAAGIVLDLLG